MSRRLFYATYLLAYACAAAWIFWPTPAHAEQITFPAHVGYASNRWAPTYGNRIKVCPLPTPVPACLLGDGWIDPDEVSPIPGYWLRHIIVRADGAAVLFFCRDGSKCEGDE